MCLTKRNLAEDDTSTYRTSQQLDRQLIEDGKKSEGRITVLLLGASEAGKSTVLKQMRIVFGKHVYSEDEKTRYKEVIRMNLIQIASEILNAINDLNIQTTSVDMNRENMDFYLDSLKNKSYNYILSDDPSYKVACRLIRSICSEPSFKHILKNLSNMQILDSVFYWYPNEVERVLDPTFSPTEKDILQSRITTTAIQEYEFPFSDRTLKIVDVGGSRSMRRTWYSLFSDVNCVIFVTAISCYCQRMKEIPTMNRMVDSIALFDSVINNQYLKNIPFILFLNKIDLFKNYLAVYPITMAFPEYDKDNSFAEASLYIAKKFISMNKNPKRQIYTYSTFATDKKQLQKILESVEKILLKTTLNSLGLIK